jgi:hypothetical protein
MSRFVTQIQAFLDGDKVMVFGHKSLEGILDLELRHGRDINVYNVNMPEIKIHSTLNDFRMSDGEIVVQLGGSFESHCEIERHRKIEQLKMAIVGILFDEGFKVVSSTQQGGIEKILMLKEA